MNMTMAKIAGPTSRQEQLAQLRWNMVQSAAYMKVLVNQGMRIADLPDNELAGIMTAATAGLKHGQAYFDAKKEVDHGDNG